jgi:chemotaxis regulatin CheY-phosphate phosphatase CheZ
MVTKQIIKRVLRNIQQFLSNVVGVLIAENQDDLRKFIYMNTDKYIDRYV